MLGYKIKKIREEKGLSTYQLAKIITDNGYKISQSAISKIENGKRKVDMELLDKLTEALDISWADLLDNEKQREEFHLSDISTERLIEELNSRKDFPIKIVRKYEKDRKVNALPEDEGIHDLINTVCSGALDPVDMKSAEAILNNCISKHIKSLKKLPKE